MDRKLQSRRGRGLGAPGRRSLLLLPQQGLRLLQPSLNFLNPLVGILGRTVQLLLQEAQPHAGLTQLLPLGKATLQFLSSSQHLTLPRPTTLPSL